MYIQARIAQLQQSIPESEAVLEKQPKDSPAWHGISASIEVAKHELADLLTHAEPEPTVEELAAAAVEQEARDLDVAKRTEEMRQADPRIPTGEPEE